MKNSVNSYLCSHHHTALCVENWERSVSFYESLGFTVENDWFWPDGTTNHKSLLRFSDRPGCWLELFEYPDGAGTFTERFRTSAGSVYEYVLAVRQKADVDSLCEYALANGGRPRQSPCNRLWSGQKAVLRVRMASVAGPDGETITFLWEDKISLEDTSQPSVCPPGTSEDKKDAVGKILDFHHNSLRVENLERSIAFYDRLGFSLRDIYQEAGSPIRFALMHMDSGSGLLLREEADGTLPSDVQRLRTPGTLFQYCFLVDRPEGIDAVYDYCLTIGARERIAPFWHDGYGMKHWEDHPAFVYGPDDEILEFLYIDYKEQENQ